MVDITIYIQFTMIYWLLGGGGRKISVQEQMQFDIVKELSHMKPLRKVSKQQLDIGMHQCVLMMKIM